MRNMLIFLAFMSGMVVLPAGTAIGQGLQEAIVVAERQNRDVKVVLYMTPW
jgi:hypothetical protein